MGASEGIGFELVKRWLDKGWQVIASSRHAQNHSALLTLQAQFPQQLALLDCDVSDNDLTKLTQVVQQAYQCFGRIDLWFYNVGSYQPMTLAQMQLDAFESMTQSNYLGAVGFMHALLQQPEPPKYWRWNISLASDFGLPYGGGYSAPKAALMNLAESLQPELAQHNIHLQVINHGFVKTRLTAKNDFPMMGLMTPEQAALKIDQALLSNRFEVRFPFSLSTVLGIIKRLPKSWALAITRKLLKQETHSE